jgi:transposase
VLQQMEIKEVLISKEEHRSYAVWCERCMKIHYHDFPPEVVKEGLFKERLTALVAYMKAVDHASFSTIRKFIRDVLGEKVSRGYLRKIVEKVSSALDAPYEELLLRLPLEQALNVDETGHKENGDKFWTWVFRAELYVLFKIDKSRGSQVLIEVLGKEFNGALGCDYFSAYHKYMTDFNITVQFCLAHLIRDIKYLASLPDAETRAYGQRLLAAIKGMFKVIHQHDQLDAATFDHAMECARESIMQAALNNVPTRLDKDGKEQKREAFNMARRFRDNGKAYFEFITTPGISPTNNLAEQAVRFVVIDRRITQGTRSEKGRKTNERLWTVVGTCALQGRSAFEFILAAVRTHFRNEPVPSLLSALG